MKVCFFAHYSITNCRREDKIYSRSIIWDANGFEQKNSDDASEVLCEKYL